MKKRKLKNVKRDSGAQQDRNFVAKHAVSKSGAGRHIDKHGDKAPRVRQKREWKKDIRKNMYEREVLGPVKLMDSQKIVMTQALGGNVDYSKSPNLVEARDTLEKLGLLTYDENKGTSEVTDEGKEVMRKENLIDDSDTLTPEGNKYASHGATNTAPPPAENIPGPEGEGTGDSADLSLEGFNILQTTNKMADKL